MLCANSLFAFDRILLRDLTLVRNVEVDSFNEQGVRLKSGQILTWDRIERATLTEKQTEFDDLKDRLGEPLFRIRQRLSNGDFKDAFSIAKNLEKNISSDNGPTSLMLATALFRGHLANGDRISAILPLLQCASLQNANGNEPNWIGDLRKSISPVTFDNQTLLTDELLPIFFDKQVAKETFPSIKNYFDEKKEAVAKPYQFLLGSLAIRAGDVDTAKSILTKMEEDVRLEQQSKILKSQILISEKKVDEAILELTSLASNNNRQVRIMATYWLGKANSIGSPEQRQQGALSFLQIAATYSETYPELAAAGVAEAREIMKIDGDKSAEDSLKNELRERYPNSWHARRDKLEETALGKD